MSVPVCPCLSVSKHPAHIHCTVSLSFSFSLYIYPGRYPLFIRTAVKCIKYWIRLIRLPLSRLCRQTYGRLLIQHNQGRINWVSKVQQILNENGFGIVWQCQGVGYEDRFIAEFKDRIMSCYKQNWHSNIEGNEKYKWFYTFKDSFFLNQKIPFFYYNKKIS